MEAEHPKVFPLCPRRRKREADELLLPMDLDAAESHSQQTTDKLKALTDEFGREFRVFSNTSFEPISSKLPASDQEEEDDAFYELQPADYFNLISNRIGEQSNILKTRKMREAEIAAQRAKRTKAVMRVRFPDGYILEANFHPSETVHSLVDLLMKVIARPDLPFYLCFHQPLVAVNFRFSSTLMRILVVASVSAEVGFVPVASMLSSFPYGMTCFLTTLLPSLVAVAEAQGEEGIGLGGSIRRVVWLEGREAPPLDKP
ncbi:hypothetical protein GUJ93_ZPchr0004g38920 [Zizania palustris]|uniref:UBX domain-containing protein n=1 Tax=Zizania palustris TaxID=103762 RepID=A0A8J5SQF1_ZIZPA|nr:hypothetical protein GUJ93_ZPchr0004g38920 [Zizania palustris]